MEEVIKKGGRGCGKTLEVLKELKRENEILTAENEDLKAILRSLEIDVFAECMKNIAVGKLHFDNVKDY